MALTLLALVALTPLAPAAPGAVDFLRQIKPLLEASCASCHGPTKQSGGYRVDRRELALGQGDSGPAIIPGQAARSPLVMNVARTGDSPMPPDGKGRPLTTAEVALLRAWIDQGAPWPQGLTLSAPAARPDRTVTLPPPVARKVDFVKEVRPLFEARCFGCHGPTRQEADLRLDTRAIALGNGSSGPVIVPGRSAESLLVRLVAGAEPDRVMPAKGQRLTAAEIALVRGWIDQGAAWPDGLDPPGAKSKLDHWSFKAPVPAPPPALPGSAREGWPRNAIDRFVLAAMDRAGLVPSAQADRPTLIRRLSLDLLGLPPTPAEVDAFAADRRPDAYQRLVDRLLASPHHGERWGRHWLDAARYADTNGFEKDATRSIWPYRDWVISALNRDMPFDRFATEQLAGDLLPGATREQRTATGFLRNSMLNEEGGVDPEQFRVEQVIDRVDAVGKAFLGLTINCAQCHTHKFDPIQHTEYYRFFAFLNDDDEDDLEVLSPAETSKRQEIAATAARLEQDAMAADRDVSARMTRWEREVAAKAGNWKVLDEATIHGAFGIKFEKLADGSLIARGDRYLEGIYTISATTKLTGITAFRVEVLTDDSLPRGGPGRDKEGVAVLTEIAVLASAAQGGPPAMVPLPAASADFAARGGDAARAIDGDNKTGWSTDAGPGRRNQARVLVVRTERPVGFPAGTALTFVLSQKQGQQRTIGRVRLSVTTAPAPVADPLSAAARVALAVPPARRTLEQTRALFTAYRGSDPRFAALGERLDTLYKDWPYGPTTLVVSARDQPRKTAVFKRGDWRRPGAAVRPGTPAALHPFPADAPRNRLGLARWIVDPRNPLTARVIVNRIWISYFGQGLVATPEDLGTRADPASHPEFLDWLALEFRERGWSLKALHRLIVASATYQQSSRATPEALARDPYNRWLARAPRLRVEAEVVRDVALAASGLLSRKVGGPSVFPPLPEGVMTLGYGSPMKWETPSGEDRYRRGLYTFWKRSVPYPSLSVFDAPGGDFACVRRVRSNTPLQALTTLNDQAFHEAAQAMGLRVWREGGKEDRQRAVYAFRLAVGRQPTQADVGDLLSLLHKQRRHFQGNTAAAVLVAASDPTNPPPGLDLHQVAPWVMVSRVLLNMDETITRE